MSRYQMNERDKRALTWGAWILLPSLLFVFGVRPYLATLAETREQLSFERDALAREQAAITSSRRNPELQRIADSLMRKTEPRLFSGRDDVMASAELVSYLDELARNHHVLLEEDATRPALKARSGVRTLNVEIRGESDLHGILDFLQQIERGPKLLKVQRLDLSRPARDADDVETIMFTATVSGFALVEETPFSNGRRPATNAVMDPDSRPSRGAP